LRYGPIRLCCCKLLSLVSCQIVRNRRARTPFLQKNLINQWLAAIGRLLLNFCADPLLLCGSTIVH